jgi:glycine betaine/proline transport system ATP-binding protein
VDGDGHPATISIAGHPGRLIPYENGAELRQLDRYAVVLAPAAIKLREALEIRHRTGNPVALIEDGRLIGAIGDDEIYRGILRQTGATEGSRL